MGYLVRFAFMIGAAALFAGCGRSLPSVTTPSNVNNGARPSAGRETFKYSGAEQWFTVPTGVSMITVVVRGAQGGVPKYYGAAGGGRGGRVYAQIPVTSGEKLAVFVGGQGSDVAGGFNGGGNPGTFSRTEIYGGGGGGASDVREGGDALQNRVIVAGGGGGQGCCPGGDGGAGGGLIGARGAPGQSDGGGVKPGHGGRGGHPMHGGGGGRGGKSHYDFCPGGNGADGLPGDGGQGGDAYCGPTGGGGGGGYFGGGGGGGGCGYCGTSGSFRSEGGGGGGGSSFIESRASRVKMWRGWKNATGDGLVIIRWQ